MGPGTPCTELTGLAPHLSMGLIMNSGACKQQKRTLSDSAEKGFIGSVPGS